MDFLLRILTICDENLFQLRKKGSVKYFYSNIFYMSLVTHEKCPGDIRWAFIFNLRSVQRRCVYACGHVWLVAIINKSSEKNNDIVVTRHLAAGSNL